MPLVSAANFPETCKEKTQSSETQYLVRTGELSTLIFFLVN
jgi:hypothetical protein